MPHGRPMIGGVRLSRRSPGLCTGLLLRKPMRKAAKIEEPGQFRNGTERNLHIDGFVCEEISRVRTR